jgi:Tol biopolymer transport system component
MQRPTFSIRAGVARLLAVLASLGIVAPAYAVAAPQNGDIAFSAMDGNGDMNIFVSDQNGSNRVQWTWGQSNGVPSWSPDGTRLTYVCQDPAGPRDYVCITAGDGQTSRISDGRTPMWGKNDRIAYSSGRTGASEIWIMNLDGSGQIQITNAPGFEKLHPVWSPDCKQLAYAQWDLQGLHVSIWIVNVDGSEAHQATTGTGWYNYRSGNIINTADDANSPDWNPVSGQLIFWSGTARVKGQIWAMWPDGTGRIQLTHNPSYTNSDDPEWSPDGTKILYTTTITRSPDVWMMNADGSEQHKAIARRLGPTTLEGDSSWRPK